MPRSDFVYIYGFYFLFLSQYLAAVALFCFSFPRRRLFLLRLVASLAVCAGLACIWSDAAKAYTVLIILRYFVLFMAGFGAVLFCFDVSPLMALFCATGGYALQHFSYIFASFASAWLRAETWKVLSAFVYVGIFAALYAAGYLFFASCMKRAKDVLSREKAVIFFSAGVLLCVIVFSALCDTSDFGGLYSAFFACRGFEAMCCLLSLGLMRLLFRGKQAESEMREMRILWEKEKQQYRMTRDRVDLINIKCHDIKKYIAQLRERPSDISERELGELESLVSVYDRSVKTGNEAIDVVLADKSLSCERAGVRLSCMLDGKLFSFMSSSDVYSLFGNLLDNALSAAEAVSDPEKRVISLTCRRSAGLLFLHEENYYEGELRRDGERFLSTTGDDDFHGFGTKSIVWTARKYGGEAQFSARGGIFSLDVVLPQPKET